MVAAQAARSRERTRLGRSVDFLDLRPQVRAL